MRNCISLARWKGYGHCLSPLIPSTTRLGVASGGKIWPYGRWWGEVAVGGVQAGAWFEVFECGGAFDIILGKPWLHSMRAIHNYETDEIHIRTAVQEAMLQNEEAGVAELEARQPAGAPASHAEAGQADGVPEALVTMATEVEIGTKKDDEGIVGEDSGDAMGVVEEDMDAEEQWRREEVARIARRREKDRSRKAAQLERRAEQPLSFPGLGYSPPLRVDPKPREPRPFPVDKRATPELYAEPLPHAKSATQTVYTKQASGLEDEERQLEDELVRIHLVQAHAPWTESRFAKYLNVEVTGDTDTLPEACDNPPETAAETETPLGWRQRDELRRQAANRLWNDTLAAAQRANAKDKSTLGQHIDTAANQRRRRDAEDAAKWALQRQLKAVSQILQLNVSSVGSQEQLQSLVTSEVRIKHLCNKLDELRAMVEESVGDKPDSGHEADDVNMIGDVSAAEFKLDRGTNTTMRATDPFDEARVQEILSKIQIGSDLTEEPFSHCLYPRCSTWIGRSTT
ncbi:hypothetical protein DFH09DRAFT_1324998 [Mycena vulgaris]|nr:hypothetical protein DFH09DRAFT_1324998 [Mycena vulgaris]